MNFAKERYSVFIRKIRLRQTIRLSQYYHVCDVSCKLFMLVVVNLCDSVIEWLFN